MGSSILDTIPHHVVDTGVERIDLYRLGEFEGAMYELVELQAGQHYPPHRHLHSDATLHIVAGTGFITLDDYSRRYAPGSSFHVTKGASHGFTVDEQTLFLSIQRPPIVDQQTGRVDVEYTGSKP